MSGLAVAGSNSVIIIASKKVSWKPEPKGLKITTLSRFTANDPKTGKNHVFKYRGEMGNEEAFSIDKTRILNLDKPIDKHNYLVLLQHLQVDEDLKAIITIKDDQREAEEYSKTKRRIVALAGKLSELYDGDKEAMRNMYRRRYGNVSGITDAIIYKTLDKLIEEEPETVELLMKDIQSQDLVLIAKALEMGLLFKNGNVYLNVNHSPLAGSEQEMLLYLRNNEEFATNLRGLVRDAFDAAITPTNKVTFEQDNPLSEFEDLTEVADFHTQADDQQALEQEEIVRVVKIAVKTNLIDKINNKYIVHNTEYSRKELDDYYLANPPEAVELKQELVAAKLWEEAD